MHPASSVIFFTSLSGLGYGLIVALLLSRFFNFHDFSDGSLAIGLTIGLLIASIGLLLSLFHLGHPERAWRALSQWRSSWLSREGVLAIAAFAPVVGIVGLLATSSHEYPQQAFLVLGVLAIVLSLATVFATAMIYRSLNTIDAWHTNWVPIVYLWFSVMSGFVFCAAYLNSITQSAGRLPQLAIGLILVGIVLKLFYWSHIGKNISGSTIDTALGLKDSKNVTQFTAPHTQDNFLLHEMGFEVARHHATKLKKISLVCGFGVSITFLALYFFELGKFSVISLWLSVIAMMIGVLVERWLFFAEAKHSVTLYYGR